MTRFRTYLSRWFRLRRDRRELRVVDGTDDGPGELERLFASAIYREIEQQKITRPRWSQTEGDLIAIHMANVNKGALR